MSIDINNYKTAPLFKSLIELNERLIERDTPPVTLNIVGGFALMIHDLRDKADITDIDYIGSQLPKEIEDISEEIGRINSLPKHWINNDIMLAGSSLEDFTLSTGDLHFFKAFELEKITINVIEPEDLLRLKVIAIDTALSAVEVGGDFTRMKDFEDIIKLSNKLGSDIDSFEDKYSDYIVNIKTVPVIQAYKEYGIDGVEKMLKKINRELLEREAAEPQEEYHSPFIDSILQQAMDRLKAEKDQYGFEL